MPPTPRPPHRFGKFRRVEATDASTALMNVAKRRRLRHTSRRCVFGTILVENTTFVTDYFESTISEMVFSEMVFSEMVLSEMVFSDAPVVVEARNCGRKLSYTYITEPCLYFLYLVRIGAERSPSRIPCLPS